MDHRRRPQPPPPSRADPVRRAAGRAAHSPPRRPRRRPGAAAVGRRPARPGADGGDGRGGELPPPRPSLPPPSPELPRLRLQLASAVRDDDVLAADDGHGRTAAASRVGLGRSWPRCCGSNAAKSTRSRADNPAGGGGYAGWSTVATVRTGPAFGAAPGNPAPGRGPASCLPAGIMQLVTALVASGLVDEYRLLVYPFVAGEGQRLFADATDPLARSASWRPSPTAPAWSNSVPPVRADDLALNYTAGATRPGSDPGPPSSDARLRFAVGSLGSAAERVVGGGSPRANSRKGNRGCQNWLSTSSPRLMAMGPLRAGPGGGGWKGRSTSPGWRTTRRRTTPS
jgi:hypothetical protein